MTPAVKKSFLLAVSAMAIVELIARVFFPSKISGRFEYGYDPMAGFVEKADGTIHLTRTGGRHFWPQTFKRERPPNVFRIMVVGDSVPRASSLQNSYAWLLAEDLRKAGVNAEGWNLAIGGYGSRRKSIVFQQALHYQPSLMVLHVNSSDEFEDDREWRRKQEFQDWHPKNWPMKMFIIRRLYEAKTEQVFWHLLPNAVRKQTAIYDPDILAGGKNAPEKQAEWRERVRGSTLDCIALARKAGIPIVLVTQSHYDYTGSNATRILGNKGLDEMTAPMIGDGVYRVSMQEVFGNRNDLKNLFMDTAHLVPAGHTILAQAIFDELEKQKLIPVRSE